jgi:hypothetical protein
MMPTIEITIEELRDSYDWGEVFGEGDGRNCSKTVDSIAGCPTDPVSLAGVSEIIAAANGENDGDAWVGLFLLSDGRYLIAEGSCDYTGWDCQAGNHLAVASTLDDGIAFGLTPEQRKRLGV